MKECADDRERERFGWWRGFKKSANAALSEVCLLRQVLYNGFGLIKSSVQLRQVERKAAD